MKIPDRPNPTDVFPRRAIIEWWAERSIPDDGSSAEDRNKKLRREKDRLRKQLLHAFPPDGDDGDKLEFGKVADFFRHPPEKYRNEHTPRLREIANGAPATIELFAKSPVVAAVVAVESDAPVPLMDYPRDMDDAVKQISDLRLQVAALQRENRKLRLIENDHHRLKAKMWGKK
jgi:regulator of replication initiation timing